MQVKGTLKESDFIAAMYLQVLPQVRPLFAVLGILMFVPIILAPIFLFMFPVGTTEFLVGCFGVVNSLYLAALFFIYIPWRGRNKYKQSKTSSKAFSIEVREEGLCVTKNNVEGFIPWTSILKWRYNKKVLIFFITRNKFSPVPSHCFVSPEAYSEFVKILEKRVGNAT